MNFNPDKCKSMHTGSVVPAGVRYSEKLIDKIQGELTMKTSKCYCLMQITIVIISPEGGDQEKAT